MFALALAKDSSRVGLFLLDIGLDDASNGLALRDVIAHRHFDRRQSSCCGGHGIYDAATTADQKALAKRPGRDSPKDAPCERGGQAKANDDREDPVERFGNIDELVQLFRRRGSLQRDGTKCPLR